MKKFRLKSISILMVSAIILSACESAGVDNSAAETAETAEEAVDNDETEVDSDSDKVEVSEDDTTAETADSDAEESEENGIRPFTIDGITHGIGDGWIEFEFSDDEINILDEIIRNCESGEYETLYDRIMSESLVAACERYNAEAKSYLPMCVIFKDYKVYLSAYNSEDIGDRRSKIILTPIEAGKGYYYMASESTGGVNEGVVMHSFAYGVCPCEQGTFNGDSEYYEHMWQDIPDNFDEENPGTDLTIDSMIIEKGILNNGVRDGEWAISRVDKSYRGWSDFSNYERKYYSKGRVDVIKEEETDEDSVYGGKILYYYSIDTDEAFSPVNRDSEDVAYKSYVYEDQLEHLHSFYDDYISQMILMNGYGDSNTLLF